MSKETLSSPSLVVKILIWGYLILFSATILFDSSFNHYLIAWLYESFPLEQANRFFSWFFRIFYSWLTLVALWLLLLGVKTYNVQKYPPGGLPIPLKTKQLTNESAKRRGALLCGIALVIFVFGGVFVYHDYIWSSSDL
jgi:hypothetical protein